MIAAVNGHALGLGLTLALQCDIRFFAADARYGVVQVRRGVVGDAYSHWILPRLVGISNAAEILLTGASFRRASGGAARSWRAGPSTPTTLFPPRWRSPTTSRRTPRRCPSRPASGCCGTRSASTARPSVTARPTSTVRSWVTTTPGRVCERSCGGARRCGRADPGSDRLGHTEQWPGRGIRLAARRAGSRRRPTRSG